MKKRELSLVGTSSRTEPRSKERETTFFTGGTYDTHLCSTFTTWSDLSSTVSGWSLGPKPKVEGSETWSKTETEKILESKQVGLLWRPHCSGDV